MNKYDISFDYEKRTPVSVIAQNIPRNSMVLEFGCGNGRLTKYLKEKLGCRVYIVEQDSELYEKAAQYAEEGLCGDIEQLAWLEKFPQKSFDFAVFADVLEHLKNPERVLRVTENMLKKDGAVWISVPNMAHNDILLRLFDHSLAYTDTGIMDETHLRVFNYQNLCEMIKCAGYETEIEDCVSRSTGCTEQYQGMQPDLSEFLRILACRPFGEIYQFVFKIVPKGSAKTHKSYLRQNEDELERYIYFDMGEGYRRETRQVFYGHKKDIGFQVKTEIPSGAKVLRFDPVINMPCKISNLTLLSNKGRLTVADSNGRGEEDSLEFATFHPSLYVTDLEDVTWISISGEIIYDYDLIEKGISAQLIGAENEIALLKEKDEEWQREVAGYKIEQEDLYHKIEVYEEQKGNRDAECAKLRDILEDQNRQIAGYREYQEELLDNGETLKKELQSLQIQLGQAAQEKDQLNRENGRLNLLLETEQQRRMEMNDLCGKYQEEAKSQKAETASLRDEMQKAVLKIGTLQQLQTDTLEQLKVSETKVGMLQQAHTETMEQLKASQTQELRCRQEIAEYRAQASSQHEQLRAMEAEKQKILGQLEEVGAKCKAQESQAMQYKEQLKELERTCLVQESRETQYQNQTVSLIEQIQKLEQEKKNIADVSEQRDKNISHLQRLVEQMKADYRSLQGQTRNQQEMIALYQNSTSWRMTEPLRRMGRFVRKRFRGGIDGNNRGSAANALPVLEPTALIPADVSCNMGEWDWDVAVSDYAPLVSVIVPNYNHEQYLRERLDSIYGQTYPNFEVILLDDCSTDHSRDILDQYAEMHKAKTRTIYNEKNCGRIFEQWNRGINTAKGELIWIAESDDFCEPDFLEVIVPLLARRSVMLAFARSVFMTEGKETWNTEQYLADIPGISWDQPFTMTAYRIVQTAFSIKNIIPNVSSAVFRNSGPIEDDIKTICSGMKLSGDWVFYLSRILGGCISYTNKTTNYYRIHEKSTSLKVQQSRDYYQEYEQVSMYAAEHYKVPAGNYDVILGILKEHYKAIHHTANGDAVEEYYSPERIRLHETQRKPNVGMVCYSLQPGGGEVYGVYLANAMKHQDVPVTLIDLRMGQTEPSIAAKVDPSVPVVSVKSMDYMYQVISQLGLEIVHTHHGSADMALADWLKNGDLSTKQIITLHGMYEMMQEDILKKTLDVVDAVCSKYVYIADKNLEPFQRTGHYQAKRFIKMPNGLPEEQGPEISRSELGIGKADFVFVLASRGIEEKGWREAIEAIRLASAKSKKRLHLIIIGDGEIRKELQESAPECVHFMGIRQDVRSFYKMGDAGIVPTRFKGESYPLVVIECLQSGRPVIATDIAEVRTQLADEKGDLAGILLQLENGRINVRKLAEDMTNLANDMKYYRRLKKRCAGAAKKFDLNKITKDYLAVYQEALKD